MKNKTSRMGTIKKLVGDSNDGGDKNHQEKSLRKHMLHTPIKRKINMSSVEINAPEYQESPHAMDIDEIIEEPDCSAQRLVETREIVDSIMNQDPEIFEK